MIMCACMCMRALVLNVNIFWVQIIRLNCELSKKKVENNLVTKKKRQF